MKQKLLLTFARLLTAVTGAWAESWTSGACTVTLEGTILTVSGSGAMGDYGNPEDQPWYSNRSSITTVSIEDGVTTIGQQAFDGCTNLATVAFPASVTSIGNSAFSHTGLTSIDINVMMIGDNAFADCTNLTTVNIGSNVSTIGNNAFAGCRNLANITVDENNTHFDSRDNCNAIIDKDININPNTLVVGCKGTTIPNSVTSIDNYAFSGSGLTSITIPASVTSIGDNAFYNSSSLASVTVYATTPPTLGDDAFYGCAGGFQIYVFSNLVDDYQATNWNDYTITGLTGGYCGTTGHESDVVWVLTGTTPNYTLTISGSGAMANYGGSNQPWYSNRTSISSIVIEDGVTYIGEHAFDGCNNAYLTSVTIPASVTEIGSFAFNNCTGLATVTFASGSQLTSIGSYAFLNSGLTSITIPASVTSIGMQAFDGCSNLATVSGCEGVTYVGSYAFKNTAWLTNQPNGVIYIGKVAYLGKNVSGVVSINAGTVSISDRAFYYCTGLTAVSIPASVTSIGYEAFKDCTSLATVTFASGSQLSSIGQDAFYNSGLTSIAIPASVTSIGDDAFSVCWNLATITVDGGNTTYDSRNNCNAIIKTTSNTLVVGCKGTTIPNTVTSIGNYAFFGSGLTSITIPASVETIDDYAFQYCDDLASVTVYASDPPSLGSSVFNSCNQLDYIYVFSDLVDDYQGAWSAYQSIITAMTNPNGTCGVAPNASDVRWVLTGTTPNYTLTIMKVGSTGAMEDYAAEDTRPWHGNRSSITSIVIENGVTSIGARAFYNCDNPSLASITIPASVTSIGYAAFLGCTMPSVTFADGSQLATISDYAFEECLGLTSFTIPDGVTSIGNSAFMGCANLASVTIPASVETIDDYAFSLCTGLTSITIPASVTTIGKYTFKGSGLTSITIPNSVTSIGKEAFSQCENLATVTLNSNPKIDANAFKNYTNPNPTVTMNLMANSADEKYWMTFYNENYNFQADANTQVFKAALSDTKVSLTELTTDKIVNKDNAVLLKSTASPIVMTLTSTNSENVFTGNDLNGVSDPAGHTAADPSTTFVLNKGTQGVGFYRLTTDKTLGVGKAYLTYSGSLSNFFDIDDDGTTGIDNGQLTIDNSDKVFYDLNGRRVMNPTKGIYIVNGKKVLLK